MLYATDRRVDAYLLKALREAGHLVEATGRPADAVEMAATGGYEAILLDWSSPSIDCAARFAAAAAGPLMLLIAANGGEADRAAVLKAGADACFIRPVPFIELEARLTALARLVRRTRPSNPTSGVELVASEQTVRLNGRGIALSSREYRLMEHLVAHAGEVVSLERLHQHVWGDAAEPRPDLARASISRLRRKLDAAGAAGFVRSVPGHGYAFEPGVAAPPVEA